MMTIRQVIEELSGYDPDTVLTFTYVDENKKEKLLTLEKISPTNLLWAERKDGVVEFTTPDAQVVAWQKGIRVPQERRRRR